MGGFCNNTDMSPCELGSHVCVACGPTSNRSTLTWWLKLTEYAVDGGCFLHASEPLIQPLELVGEETVINAEAV